MDIAQLRHEFKRESLLRENLNKNPFTQFSRWLNEAIAHEHEPNALTLATADSKGNVSARTVLLKTFDKRGFCFFSNYQSRKAQYLLENKSASMLFPWLKLERQIEIRGIIEKVSFKESEDYFHKRPRGSQIGAWVSPQSSVIADRKILEDTLKSLEQRFQDKPIPLPEQWGGYRLIPKEIEFWQGRPNRLHDRFRYSLQGDNLWKIERLAP